MSSDEGVSSVIGTVLLLALVVVAAGIVSLAVVASVTEEAVSGPIVTFEESYNPQLLYHAGGDVLEKSTLRISWGDRDITSLTMSDSMPGDEVNWTVWKTGEYLDVSGAVWEGAPGGDRTCTVSEIVIVYRAGSGKEFLLYAGANKSSGVLPPSPVKKYTVTVETPVNGRVTGLPATAAAGESVSGTATPDSGYTLSKVTVTYTATGVEYISVTSPSFTFTMPAADVTVNATFTPTGTPPGPIDVPIPGEGIIIHILPYVNASITPYGVNPAYLYKTSGVWRYSGTNGHGIIVNITGADDKLKTIKNMSCVIVSEDGRLIDLYRWGSKMVNGKRETQWNYTSVNPAASDKSYGFWLARGDKIIDNVYADDAEHRNVTVNITLGFFNGSILKDYKADILFTIPKRVEGLQPEPLDVAIYNATYAVSDVNTGSKRGVVVNITGGGDTANQSRVSGYVIQDVSGKLNNVTLVYDSTKNAGSPDLSNFKSTTNTAPLTTPYYYYIPDTVSPDAIDDVTFLITTYYHMGKDDGNSESWTTDERLVTMDLAEIPDQQPPFIRVTVSGYQKGQISGIPADKGHGLNITVTGGFNITNYQNINANMTTEGGTLYSGWEENKKKNRLGADDVLSDDKVLLGSKFYFYIGPTDNGIPAGKIMKNTTVVVTAENKSNSNLREEIWNSSWGAPCGLVDIPSRYAFPSVNMDVASYIWDDGTKGYNITITNLNKVTGVNLESASLVNASGYAVDLIFNTSLSDSVSNIVAGNTYYYEIDTLPSVVEAGTLTVTFNRTDYSQLMVNSTKAEITIPAGS